MRPSTADFAVITHEVKTPLANKYFVKVRSSNLTLHSRLLSV